MKKQSKLSSGVLKAISNTNTKRVEEIARELQTLGLAIAVPHIHTEAGVDTLPQDTVQYEKDLHVSFPKKDSVESQGTFPAMWRFDQIKNELVVCGRCSCDD